MNPLWSTVSNAAVLKAFSRERYMRTTGKYVAAQMRKDGFVPAILQGKDANGNNENRLLMTPYMELEKRMDKRGLSMEATLHKLELEDGTTELVLPRTVQVGTVSQKITSLTFMRYDPEKGAKVYMPIDYTDQEVCAGIKRGGFLNEVTSMLCVKVTGEVIPHALEVSVRNLDVGERMWFSDLTLPENVELRQRIPLYQDDIMLCNITGKRSLIRAVALEKKEAAKQN
ncbi:50S ribosomal protein L25 [Hondaea fermentalgiana]|uniref:50S ribosomal protein L25 n=1 Tax=Hondaea fermentalgiana TaxID=2315210 RepID=A0A2R5GVT1_9STRA|nr:50S ribosomal protein L25 [Hondaea fermentalgiana]|eukprot:GBG34952.1 50S ribosomal protein L25 [Hondaea fermentalgiana]